MTFDGLGMNLGNLARLSNAETRSISAENPRGERGKGGMATEGAAVHAARFLGQGWKVSPCIHLPAGTTITLAEIDGPGAIQHFWMTVDRRMWRVLVLRVYWDHESQPSIEVPLGDFFCNGWCQPCNVNSLPIAANPLGGFNSYWEMPFRKHARITIENLHENEIQNFFYQINYTLTDIPEDRAYLHAQWRRSNPVPRKGVHTLLDGVQGQGHYVGTYMAWNPHTNGWWGEGEIKFYLDDDTDYPTICGTGTEDYFGGAWGFPNPDGSKSYGTYSTPFLGMPQVTTSDNFQRPQQRLGLYRWHIMDPIRFQRDLRVTIQDLGIAVDEKGVARFVPLQDDIASTSLWYQVEPHQPYAQVLDRETLEVL
ncbi:MAG: DUF2961 domain-containing protein [Anaerolineae bacterium]|nr:DUF2961 domain-containing protein [Anaerolineae bacterium]